MIGSGQRSARIATVRDPAPPRLGTPPGIQPPLTLRAGSGASEPNPKETTR